MSILLSGELEVDGDLKVTGTIQNDSLAQVIDSLQTQITIQQTLIEQLQAQILLLGQIVGIVDCFGVVGGGAEVDECGVCGGDGPDENLDCDGNCSVSIDCFGVCGGSSVLDACGVCGGNGVQQICGCGTPGEYGIPEGYCNCFTDIVDACGVCGGDAISEDECIVTDFDGNIYEIVLIGEQVWMSENLKVTHYNNGDEIPTGYSNSEWIELETGAYSDYNNNPTNSETYGRLYNWYTVDDDRGVCPDGWHVPSDNEYTVLTDYLGGEQVAGGKMKETGLEHWSSPNLGATNESGFTGLPAGYRYYGSGLYYYMGYAGYFWSSSETGSFSAWFRSLSYNSSNVYRYYDGKQFGFSVRCLGD